jgi:hypothetical protein
MINSIRVGRREVLELLRTIKAAKSDRRGFGFSSHIHMACESPRSAAGGVMSFSELQPWPTSGSGRFFVNGLPQRCP